MVRDTNTGIMIKIIEPSARADRRFAAPAQLFVSPIPNIKEERDGKYKKSLYQL